MKKILVFVLSMILIFGLVGCGGSEESAEQAVKNTFDAIKSGNVDKASKYINYEGLIEAGNSDDASVESEEVAKLILKKLEYRIVSSTENEDTAVVNVEITNVDMTNIFSEYIQQAFALAFSNLDEGQVTDEGMTIFSDLLSREDNETLTSNLDIQLTKEDDGWKIDLKEDVVDAVFGGMLSATEALAGDSEEDMLYEISNWLTADIWNEGFVDISSYISNGTSSTGETLDIDFTINQLKKSMEKKTEYDSFINGLDDSEYSNIKTIWSKLSTETEYLFNQVVESTQIENLEFDTGKFQQYRDAFSDSVYED